MQLISTRDAGPAGGHYSQAVVTGHCVYVSGQLPVSAGGPLAADAPFVQQARQVLHNVTAILQASGSAPSLIVKANVYIRDIALWPQFDQLYAQWLGEHRPARCVVPVPMLHHGYLIEMDVVAVQARPAEGPR
jgi:reactive intermediate/imine deaminase